MFESPFAVTPLLAEVRTSDLWGLPPCVTVGGHQVDRLIVAVFVLTLAVFVAVHAVFLYSLVKFRRREGVAAHHTHGDRRLEIVWTVVPALIFLVLFIAGDRLWFRLRTPPPDGQALDIEVVGEQYDWLIRYPGPDSLLGHADDRLETPVNKIGLDSDDPHSRDDVELFNEIVVPVGRPVHLHLRSRDVIHSFYVPEFRINQDMVPGREIGWVSFTATRTGKFAFVCNQLCGSGHTGMQGVLRVVTEAEFQDWMSQKESAQP